MDDDNNSKHDMNEEDAVDLKSKQEQQLDVIECFLRSGSYPKHMKGRPDLKANLRKMCKKYMLNNDVLHF